MFEDIYIEILLNPAWTLSRWNTSNHNCPQLMDYVAKKFIDFWLFSSVYDRLRNLLVITRQTPCQHFTVQHSAEWLDVKLLRADTAIMFHIERRRLRYACCSKPLRMCCIFNTVIQKKCYTVETRLFMACLALVLLDTQLDLVWWWADVNTNCNTSF